MTRIMMVQNILKSDDSRLSKTIVAEQRRLDIPKSLYNTANEICKKYSIDWDKLSTMKKSELKGILKKKINWNMKENIIRRKTKKMRFLDTSSFTKKKYIDETDGDTCIKILKLRLNMVKVANNYKNNNIEDVCPHCRGHGDATEHLFSCPQLTIKVRRW